MERYWYGLRKIQSAVVMTMTFLCALIALVPLFWILYFVLRQGVSAIDLAFFTHLPRPVGEAGGGMANAMLGTLILLGIAALIGGPLGVLGGVYLSEFGKNRVGYVIRFAADVLVGVPSIVIGIFVYALIVIPMKSFSALAGGTALGIMMVPIVMRTTEESLKMVPTSLREASLAMGATKWQTVVKVVLTGGKAGVITGCLLALSRVAGETAPLLFTALNNQYWNAKITQPIASLPVQIYTYAISPYDDWHRQAWAGALVLIASVLLVNILARVVSHDAHGRVK